MIGAFKAISKMSNSVAVGGWLAGGAMALALAATPLAAQARDHDGGEHRGGRAEGTARANRDHALNANSHGDFDRGRGFSGRESGRDFSGRNVSGRNFANRDTGARDFRGRDFGVESRNFEGRNFREGGRFDGRRGYNGRPTYYGRGYGGWRGYRPWGPAYFAGFGYYYDDYLARPYYGLAAWEMAEFAYLSEQQVRAQEDAMIAATSGPLNDPIEWNDGNASGSVTALRDGQTGDGRTCREFQQQITVDGKKERAYGTACREPDGSWQVVEK